MVDLERAIIEETRKELYDIEVMSADELPNYKSRDGEITGIIYYPTCDRLYVHTLCKGNFKFEGITPDKLYPTLFDLAEKESLDFDRCCPISVR